MLERDVVMPGLVTYFPAVRNASPKMRMMRAGPFSRHLLFVEMVL